MQMTPQKWWMAYSAVVTVALLVSIGLSFARPYSGFDRGDRGYGRMEMNGKRDFGNHQNSMGTMMSGMDHSAHMGMSGSGMTMSDMTSMLAGKTGDELDKAFLSGMIEHHQGALDMAAYLKNAKHPELQKMGEDIIKTQTAEIEQMKKWQSEWGYTGTGSMK